MPKLVDVDPLRLALARLVPDEPRTHRGLTVIALLAPGTDDPDWLTLPEAGGAVQITEATEAGEVPFLTVVNAGDRPVLLLDGEELVGAKQNRVLNRGPGLRRRRVGGARAACLARPVRPDLAAPAVRLSRGGPARSGAGAPGLAGRGCQRSPKESHSKSPIGSQ